MVKKENKNLTQRDSILYWSGNYFWTVAQGESNCIVSLQTSYLNNTLTTTI